MPAERAFIDTNVLIYLFSDDDIDKKNITYECINKYERFISTQVLNEFCNVCIKKLGLSFLVIQNAVVQLCDAFNVVVNNQENVLNALKLHEKYGYTYYDSLIIASAIDCDCKFLLTEDLADGQTIENNLIIHNIYSCGL